jgi:hypothetical protein
MGLARAQMMTGAQTLQLGTVKGWQLQKHDGREVWVHYPVAVLITMQEWIKALCGDHRPEFKRSYVTSRGEALVEYQCKSCGQAETVLAE